MSIYANNRRYYGIRVKEAETKNGTAVVIVVASMAGVFIYATLVAAYDASL